jgi:mannan polymerase II complex ANP1 subunit
MLMLTIQQMAKRMQFSVVGLPHYTIWHLYEPSVDDLRHMEEMEKEKKDKEAKLKSEIETIEKIKSQFDNPKRQWEQDKTTFQDIAHKASTEKPGNAQKDTNAAHQKEKVPHDPSTHLDDTKLDRLKSDQM